MDLQSLQQLIADYGVWFYIITFLWTFVEGETFVIYAGVLIAQGLLDGPLLLACAWAGSFCGDQTYFYTGRYFGPRVLRRFPRWQKHIDQAAHWLKKHDALFILSFRWVYGIRNFASFALGMSPLRGFRFLYLNFIAAGLWAIGFVGIGYVAGQLLRPVLEQVAHYFTLVMLGIFALMFGLVFLVHRLQAMAARRRSAMAAAEVPMDAAD